MTKTLTFGSQKQAMHLHQDESTIKTFKRSVLLNQDLDLEIKSLVAAS